jgi:hypothetical protein
MADTMQSLRLLDFCLQLTGIHLAGYASFPEIAGLAWLDL